VRFLKGGDAERTAGEREDGERALRSVDGCRPGTGIGCDGDEVAAAKGEMSEIVLCCV
jgi:hypothetical protein